MATSGCERWKLVSLAAGVRRCVWLRKRASESGRVQLNCFVSASEAANERSEEETNLFVVRRTRTRTRTRTLSPALSRLESRLVARPAATENGRECPVRSASIGTARAHKKATERAGGRVESAIFEHVLIARFQGGASSEQANSRRGSSQTNSSP